MYIHSVKLINFKSIGDYPEAEVILEPRVTAIIGKNESGKSNVLEGLSYIKIQDLIDWNEPNGEGCIVSNKITDDGSKPISVEKQ